MNMQTLKQQAGAYAAQFVESGMVIGLGTGSTAIFATRRIAQRIHSGDLRDTIAIPTSLATETDAQRLGIPLSTLEHHPRINLTIDGADEVDPDFNVIKGGGGAALLREKNRRPSHRSPGHRGRRVQTIRSARHHLGSA